MLLSRSSPNSYSSSNVFVFHFPSDPTFFTVVFIFSSFPMVNSDFLPPFRKSFRDLPDCCGNHCDSDDISLGFHVSVVFTFQKFTHLIDSPATSYLGYAAHSGNLGDGSNGTGFSTIGLSPISLIVGRTPESAFLGWFTDHSAFIIGSFNFFQNVFMAAFLANSDCNAFFPRNNAMLVGAPPEREIQSVNPIALFAEERESFFASISAYDFHACVFLFISDTFSNPFSSANFCCHLRRSFCKLVEFTASSDARCSYVNLWLRA